MVQFLSTLIQCRVIFHFILSFVNIQIKIRTYRKSILEDYQLTGIINILPLEFWKDSCVFVLFL